MLFVCHPKILHKLVFSFFWELKWPQEILKTMFMQNFGVTNKEDYGMFWYSGIFWSGQEQLSHLTSGLLYIVNPLLTPVGIYLLQTHLRGGGLFERWGLFNLVKTMVSVLHKELCKMKNWKSLGTRSSRSCSRGSKTDPNFQQVNKPSWVSSTQHFTVVID